MEKIFSINKWFVLFCGIFVAVWLALQFVSDKRLEEIAKVSGKGIFTWVWLEPDIHSEADITKAEVKKRTATDAKVKITGVQRISASDKSGKSREEIDATLTFYRAGRNWVLGGVEFN